MEPAQKYVIAWGNPWDGIELIGTFDSREACNEYAESYLDSDWWVILLQEPAQEDETP